MRNTRPRTPKNDRRATDRFKPRREDSPADRRRKDDRKDNDRSEKPFRGTGGGKPFGDRKKSFGKPGDRFQPGKPRFKKDDRKDNDRTEKPFRGADNRKPFGDRKKSFGKPGDRFQPGKPRFRKDDPNASGERTDRERKPYGKFSRENRPAPTGDAPKWNRKEKHEFYGEKKRRPRTFSKTAAKEEPPKNDGTIRLNKYISNAGICSRREADELITAGVISVNGNVITTLGYKVQPGDVVKYNDAKLKSEKPVYLLLNKPKDYITTVDDPHNRNTVMSLIRNACKERVYPVGRLDRNTTGLLLFTNDGDLADKLTHPSFQVQKVYEVHLDKNLKPEHFEEIAKGIMLEDGVIKPDEISYSPESKSVIGIELHSGRNRIVRRIFEHFGYRVTKLDRVLYAGLTKKDLPRSKWRFLSDMELASLKMMTGNKRFKAAPNRIAMAEE